MPVTDINPELFAQHIEHLVTRTGMSYMEAILHFCETRQIEPEGIVPFISDKIKNAIGREARNLHLLKQAASLL